jgi:hypothetical protein
MAHLIKLHRLDKAHDGHNDYDTVLYNLDTIVSMEKSPKGKHTILSTRWNPAGDMVKESLEEILLLSKQ